MGSVIDQMKSDVDDTAEKLGYIRDVLLKQTTPIDMYDGISCEVMSLEEFSFYVDLHVYGPDDGCGRPVDVDGNVYEYLDVFDYDHGVVIRQSQININRVIWFSK